MAVFVLVHGAWHGAWCWDPLSAELGARGHDAIAMDLPCEWPDATFDDYAETVLAAMDAAGVGPDAHLVGHSLGGMTIARVALCRPVARLSYVCGVVPRTVDATRDGEPADSDPSVFAPLVREAGTNFWPDLEGARQALYQECDDRTVTAAFARLRRQGLGIWRSNPPLPRYPDVPTTTVVCTDDRTVLPNWSRWVARHWLQIEAVELPGDHSPMLSRPAALAEVLTEEG